jgi:Pentapeptide repeats (8 copies)
MANLEYLEILQISDGDLSGRDVFRADLRGISFRGVNFSRANLSGADLSGADLSGTDLSGTDLSGTDLSHANLSHANLTRSQALGTNFSSAIFTGACIEDWHINSHTKLDEIICDYVYQKNRQQERKPSAGNFQAGDFTRLYQRAIETLDLIFQDGIDWKSFAVTLQTLNTEQKLNVEGENNQLSVRAIENRDDGSFVIRVDVPKSIGKAEIEAEFRQKYEIQLIAQAERHQQQIQSKDRDIEWHRGQIEWLQGNTNFQNLIPILAEHQKTPDIIINIDSKSMANNESKGDTITNSGNMGIGINRGEIEDSKIAGTIYEAPNHSLADAAAEIRELLTELEKSYPTNTTIEQMTIATEAIKRIEANPDQKKRIVNALKSGGVAAFEKVLDNPIGAFMKGAWEGWEKEL